MNTPVNFELAKLLKEKGYTIEIDYGLNQILNLKPAPTIAEIVMWLYEKHSIWISVDPENDKDTWFHTVSYNKSETIFGNYNTYNSPTEAYEAAIEYTLNNIL